jgi:hypothetical protein
MTPYEMACQIIDRCNDRGTSRKEAEYAAMSELQNRYRFTPAAAYGAVQSAMHTVYEWPEDRKYDDVPSEKNSPAGWA